MTLQQDFLGIQYLEEFPQERIAELHEALEDLLSHDIEMRNEAMTRLCEMDAHRRSPLAASFLVTRLNEHDLYLRAKIVYAIYEVIVGREFLLRPPIRVQNYIYSMLRTIGEREVYSLLELLIGDHGIFEPIYTLLNQCSMSGEILVKILACPEYPISIRRAACEIIGQIGFLEARQTIESLERRLSDRTTGQLSMAFAPRSFEEAKELIPVLRRTLDDLWEASV